MKIITATIIDVTHLKLDQPISLKPGETVKISIEEDEVESLWRERAKSKLLKVYTDDDEEEVMQGTYKEIFEKGKKNGEEKGTRRVILIALNAKFKNEISQIEEKLNLIGELKDLDFLLEKAALANSIEEFENALNEKERIK